MKINDITTLRAFKLIYDHKSLTKAAALMGLSKPALSKRLENLEHELGQNLFSRSTRSITPTQYAHQLILKVNEIIQKLDSLQSDTLSINENQKYRIKVTCIASMSHFVGTFLRQYQKKNPLVIIDLLVTDSTLDFIEHNIDLAIRVNPSKSSSLIGKKVGDYRLVAVAKPQFLKKNRLKSITDLSKYPLYVSEQHFNALSNTLKDVSQMRSFITNDSLLISELIQSGDGVGIRATWNVKENLSLALPLETFKLQGDVWLLSSSSRLQSENVRALYEKLSLALKDWLI